MKDMFKFKITILGMKSCFSNMTNAHTCAIVGMDLFTTVVLLSEGKLL
jgi:hypothetical protein